MTGLREVLRRWRIESYQVHRGDLERTQFRARTMLGAYGLGPDGR